MLLKFGLMFEFVKQTLNIVCFDMNATKKFVSDWFKVVDERKKLKS